MGLYSDIKDKVVGFVKDHPVASAVGAAVAVPAVVAAGGVVAVGASISAGVMGVAGLLAAHPIAAIGAGGLAIVAAKKLKKDEDKKE